MTGKQRVKQVASAFVLSLICWFIVFVIYSALAGFFAGEDNINNTISSKEEIGSALFLAIDNACDAEIYGRDKDLDDYITTIIVLSEEYNER